MTHQQNQWINRCDKWKYKMCDHSIRKCRHWMYFSRSMSFISNMTRKKQHDWPPSNVMLKCDWSPLSLTLISDNPDGLCPVLILERKSHDWMMILDFGPTLLSQNTCWSLRCHRDLPKQANKKKVGYFWIRPLSTFNGHKLYFFFFFVRDNAWWGVHNQELMDEVEA